MQVEDLELTAMDANEFFIALGSNVGIVYLYDRGRLELQKLKSEVTHLACVYL